MNKPCMRVLQVFGIMNRGGAETMIMNLYRAVDRNKVQFDFVVHLDIPGDYTDEIERLGGIIFYAPRYRGVNHFEYMAWWKRFFEHHPEYHIVHSHIRSTASIILAIAKHFGRTTIAHSHSISNGNGLQAAVKRLLQSKIVKYADYLFACSDAAGKWLFGEKATMGENYRVLRNAIDVHAFSYDENKRFQIRKDFGLEKSFVLGTVGRITTPKNPYGIIKIIQGVRARIPDAHFLWVGTGDLESDVKLCVEKNGMKDCVIFAGRRSDVPALLAAMDVFVFPSLWEGLPMAVIEAQASGLPCLISDTISKEVCITPLVQSIPIDDIEQWVCAIVQESSEICRETAGKGVEAAGYNIAETSEWLQAFYLQHQ